MAGAGTAHATEFDIDISPFGGALNLGANPYTQDHAVGLAAPNAVSPSASLATGGEIAAGIHYDDATNTLAFDFGYGSDNGFVDLSGNFNDVHIHGPIAVQFPSTNTDAIIRQFLGPFHTPGSSPRTGRVAARWC